MKRMPSIRLFASLLMLLAVILPLEADEDELPPALTGHQEPRYSHDR